MDLQELQERWEKELGIAESFLPDDPMEALDATRVICGEMDAYMETHPEARRTLALLRAQADAALARSREASERWLAAAAERSRRWHEHELERALRPMRDLRRPWPPETRA